MIENICAKKEHSETPFFVFKKNSGEIIQGNRMARAFYSVDSKKVSVCDVLFGLPKDSINSNAKTTVDNLITKKANGVKYKCSATLEVTGTDEVASLEVELLQDCLVKPLKEDMILSKKPEFVLIFNKNLNIYFANDRFYTLLNSNVEKIHKENKNSFLNLISKKTRKYFVEQIKNNLFENVNILQIKISLLNASPKIITFQKISNKIHGQVTDYQYCQQDIDVISKNHALVLFELSDIKDSSSGLKPSEQRKLIFRSMATRLKTVTNPSIIWGKDDTLRYSLLLELSYYSESMRKRQLQAVIDTILLKLGENYDTTTGYLTVKTSIGYVRNPDDGMNYDTLYQKSLRQHLANKEEKASISQSREIDAFSLPLAQRKPIFLV